MKVEEENMASIYEEDEREEYLQEQHANDENTSTGRGPGRPKLIRTGKPGRPRKIYHGPISSAKETGCVDTELEALEFNPVFISEIPLYDVLDGSEWEVWQQAINEELISIVRKKT